MSSHIQQTLQSAEMSSKLHLGHSACLTILVCACRAKMMGFNAARLEWNVAGLAALPKSVTTSNCDIATVRAACYLPPQQTPPSLGATPRYPSRPPPSLGIPAAQIYLQLLPQIALCTWQITCAVRYTYACTYPLSLHAD